MPVGGPEGVALAARQQAIAALKALDGEDDADFRRVTRLAARLFGAPVGVISLLDGDRLWFYARHGVVEIEAPAERSLTALLVETPDASPMAVADLLEHPEFADLGSRVDSEPVRFLAGAPIVVHGQKLGALCVAATEPRETIEDGLLAELAELATLCGSLFELKDEARVRARMAAELIKEEWRHALTLEAGKVGSWVWDVKSREIVGNDIFRQMFGLSGSGPLKVEAMMALIDQSDLEAVTRAIEETFERGADYAVEFRVAQTGRWLVGRGRVYRRDAAGRPLVMMGVNIDVTDAREAAEQQRILLRELNHRVKNTLAMIQSLARQTLRRTPEPQLFIDSFSGRLRTLSEAHTLLAERDWSGIGLTELIQTEIEPLVALDQLAIDGDDVKLPPDQALGLGLVLHELASNALKFGALSAPGGRVQISWTVAEAPRRIELAWTESGGPKVTPPTYRGFGTSLIERSLDKVLDSSVSLSFPEEGVTAKISLPLA
jgi:PAS domain S-box-containing protein